jgi:hypothetical protein
MPAMQTTEIADSLGPSEWETLKALSAPARDRRRIHQGALRTLVESDLLTVENDRPLVTAKGRQVMISGSPRLWESAA